MQTRTPISLRYRTHVCKNLQFH